MDLRLANYLERSANAIGVETRKDIPERVKKSDELSGSISYNSYNMGFIIVALNKVEESHIVREISENVNYRLFKEIPSSDLLEDCFRL